MSEPSIPAHVIAPLSSTPPGWPPLDGRIEVTHVTPDAVGMRYGASLTLSRAATQEEMREVGFQIDDIVTRYAQASERPAPAGDAR